MKIFLVILFFLIALPIAADNKILINEFVIDPQPQQVELFNSGSDNVDLGNWIIDDNGGSSGVFTIPTGTIIQPKSCLVFSRDFNLNKSTSDSARLFDSSSNLVDTYSYKSSPGQSISFSRTPDGENSWSSTSASIGYYNSDTQKPCNVIPSPTPIVTVTEEPNPTSTPTPTPITRESYINVYISEAMVSPDENGKEWVEIYNDNDFDIDLIDWYIDDEENGGSAPKKFSLNMPAKSYKGFVFDSNIFNNDQDQVRLLDFDKKLKNDFEYSDSIQGKTYGRTALDNDVFCPQDPTYESRNSQCLNDQPTPTYTPSPSPTPKPTKNPTPTDKPIKNSRSISPTISASGTTEVLGISLKREPKKLILVRCLTIVSFSYSLLTLVSVLIKMTGIYAKGLRFHPWFIYSPRKQ